MKLLGRRASQAPAEAFRARPITGDPEVLKEYFAQVASYEASERKRDRRLTRLGIAFGIWGSVIGLCGVGAVAALTPLKTVIPLAFKVDTSSGAVDRVYDVRGGDMPVEEAEKRYFLWQYVRYRQTYTAAEAETNFNAVAYMSASDVQQEYAATFKGTNPNSPQVLLGRDGSASVRWISTTFLGPKLAQIEFIQTAKKRGVDLPAQRMVATIGFDFAPGELSAAALNVNPRGFIVTSYRADMEAPQ